MEGWKEGGRAWAWAWGNLLIWCGVVVKGWELNGLEEGVELEDWFLLYEKVVRLRDWIEVAFLMFDCLAMLA